MNRRMKSPPKKKIKIRNSMYNDKVLVPFVMRHGKLIDVEKHNNYIFTSKGLSKPIRGEAEVYH